MDNNTMCSRYIHEIWQLVHFYKQLIIQQQYARQYQSNMVRIVLNGHYINFRWATLLGNCKLFWFYLPEIRPISLFIMYNLCNSQVVTGLVGRTGCSLYIMHSVVSSGQGSTLQSCLTISDEYLPISLLKAGFYYSILKGPFINV